MSAFADFAELLRQLSPQHQEVAPWPDRSDLPTEVREFWSRIGLSKLSARFAPGATPELDEHALETVFEDWFEQAITRDRWALEPDDEPIPHRYLPAKPRLLASKQRQILLASEAEPKPQLLTMSDMTPKLEPAPFSYWRWFTFELLYRGTDNHKATMWKGPQLTSEPAIAELDAPLLRIADGVYFLDTLVQKNNPGVAVLFRHLGSYAEFVLSRPESEQSYFGSPNLPTVEFKRTKRFNVDPQAELVPEGFTRHVERPRLGPVTNSLIGQLDGLWVWLRASGEKKGGTAFASCEPSDVETVQALLQQRGAQVIGVRDGKQALSAAEW